MPPIRVRESGDRVAGFDEREIQSPSHDLHRTGALAGAEAFGSRGG
jgi:hypothetical protein